MTDSPEQNSSYKKGYQTVTEDQNGRDTSPSRAVEDIKVTFDLLCFKQFSTMIVF